MSACIISFGFKHKALHNRVPPIKGFRVYDVRGIKNPHHDKALRQLNGLHPAVQKEVLSPLTAQMLVEEVVNLVLSGVTERIAFGCTAGRHRSVAFAEAVAKRLGVEPLHLDQGEWGR